jgi:hypothetical protein
MRLLYIDIDTLRADRLEAKYPAAGVDQPALEGASA